MWNQSQLQRTITGVHANLVKCETQLLQTNDNLYHQSTITNSFKTQGRLQCSCERQNKSLFYNGKSSYFDCRDYCRCSPGLHTMLNQQSELFLGFECTVQHLQSSVKANFTVEFETESVGLHF